MSGISESDNSYWKVKELFRLKEQVECMLQFESALAHSQATAGLISNEAAKVIADVCQKGAFDAAALERTGFKAGTVVIPLVKELVGQVKEISEEASRFVHFGATSQDPLDTALVLQMKKAVALIEKDTLRVERAFAALARKHGDTVMLGRTLMQSGPPISFGLKVAGWKAALTRGRERVSAAANRALVLQFGGAVGNLSVLENRGLEVAQSLAGALGLPLPDAPWHSHRDRLAELASAIGILIGTQGKIARDISLQMQSEVAELRESTEPGKGGSSAMPHKRNPVGCMHILAAANRAPSLVASLLSGMVQEHERGLGGWQAEWATIPDLFQCAAEAGAAMVEVAEELEVCPEQMQRNLEAMKEVVFSERLSAFLLPKLGRLESQDLVTFLVSQAIEEGKKLSEVALANDLAQSCLSGDELKAVFDASGALGVSAELIDRLLKGEDV